MKTLISVGRGGTGKSSFIALTAKYLIEQKLYPLLLVDVDPDQNLGEMVGIDLAEHQKLTISELLIETFLESGGTTVGIPPSERIEGKLWEKGLFEGEYFDLMAVGPKWVEGCYCLPDAALKNALKKLTKNYKFVLIDSPAGLEHLNRRITSQVDDLFDIIDPSHKAFNHIQRAYRIAKEVKITFNNFYVVGGNRFPYELEESVESRTGFPYLGKIAYDTIVEEYVLKGRSLLDVPLDSKAYRSIQNIMEKAGY